MSFKDDDIAVIGMSGRFPGANSVAEFWENLCAKKDGIRTLSDDELRAAGVPELAPVLVFASYFVGPEPFLLSFSGGAVGLLFLAVLIGAIVATHGSSNWYKGVQLLAVYLMIALMLYFVPL